MDDSLEDNSVEDDEAFKTHHQRFDVSLRQWIVLLLVLIFVVVAISVGIFLFQKYISDGTQLPQRQVFETQEMCEKETGKECMFGMCDYNCPGGNFWKGWVSTDEPLATTSTSQQNPQTSEICATYVRGGEEIRRCATCGNNVCEAFENCTSSVSGKRFATSDCGPLYCPSDCEE